MPKIVNAEVDPYDELIAAAAAFRAALHRLDEAQIAVATDLPWAGFGTVMAERGLDPDTSIALIDLVLTHCFTDLHPRERTHA